MASQGHTELKHTHGGSELYLQSKRGHARLQWFLLTAFRVNGSMLLQPWGAWEWFGIVCSSSNRSNSSGLKDNELIKVIIALWEPCQQRSNTSPESGAIVTYNNIIMMHLIGTKDFAMVRQIYIGNLLYHRMWPCFQSNKKKTNKIKTGVLKGLRKLKKCYHAVLGLRQSCLVLDDLSTP